MSEKIRKPAGWEHSSLDDLLELDAGRAYVAEQLDGLVSPDVTFHSSRKQSDSCSYQLFEDGSIWFSSNAQDEVYLQVHDFVEEMKFDGLSWEESDDHKCVLVDSMDRDLLYHLFGEDGAREFFVKHGGIINHADAE